MDKHENYANHRNPLEKYENNDIFLKKQTDSHENQKIKGIHTRIVKIIKILEIHMRIMKIMKILAINMRFMKIMKVLEI